MADNGLIVTISGAALSLLFYENVRRVGDQMGFLIGEVLTYVTKNVTDADKQVESTKIHINIQGILPCPPYSSMYDSVGELNTSALNKFTDTIKDDIVGWYRFRLNSSLTPTFRDKMLHRNLENHFRNTNNEQGFVMCILNYAITCTGSTHKFRHVLLQYKNGVYRPVPLRINNMGADASRHDGSDYKSKPINNHKTKTKQCIETVINNTPLSSQLTGYQSIIQIQSITKVYLERLVPRVCCSDEKVAELEDLLRLTWMNICTNRVLRLQSIQTNENHSLGEPYYKKEKFNEQNNINNTNDENNEKETTVSKQRYCEATKKNSNLTDI